MNTQLPQPINDYVNASNSHDVKSIVACFSESATVHDEAKLHAGKKAIEEWVAGTIGKYKFQFKPLGIENDGAETVVTMQVSGTFDGSPIELDFHFTVDSKNIASLRVG